MFNSTPLILRMKTRLRSHDRRRSIPFYFSFHFPSHFHYFRPTGSEWHKTETTQEAIDGEDTEGIWKGREREREILHGKGRQERNKRGRKGKKVAEFSSQAPEETSPPLPLSHPMNWKKHPANIEKMPILSTIIGRKFRDAYFRKIQKITKIHIIIY